MEFIQIELDCPAQQKELLIAALLQQNFDGFEETEEGLRAFIPAQTFDKMALMESLKSFDLVDYRESKIPEQNWNAQWEASFDPIEVGNLCYIRASFHAPKEEFPYDIVIDPKMAFGTGHHQTTRLMMRALLEQNVESKTVLDAGCGTGVLSILAEKLGTESIHAYDTDPWAVNNTHENVLQNHCKHIKVSQGTIDSIDRNNPYDIILANINLNVLLAETPQYVELLENEGVLILSGFYIEDVSKLVSICEANRLQLQHQLSEDGWACLIFKKS